MRINSSSIPFGEPRPVYDSRRVRLLSNIRYRNTYLLP